MKIYQLNKKTNQTHFIIKQIIYFNRAVFFPDEENLMIWRGRGYLFHNPNTFGFRVL